MYSLYRIRRLWSPFKKRHTKFLHPPLQRPGSLKKTGDADATFPALVQEKMYMKPPRSPSAFGWSNGTLWLCQNSY